MVKILHVYPRLMCGGTETVFYNLIKASDRTRFQYDILVQRIGEMDAAFRQLGCNIITIPFGNADQYHRDLAALFSRDKYQAVHCHVHGEMHHVLEEARKSGVPHCVCHSHCARIDIPKALWPLRYFKHHRYEKYATDLLGCSQLAIKWLFPCRAREGVVIYNGIDLDAFRFDKNIRREYRTKLAVNDDTKVIINVGRCSPPKNQDFILDRAKELADKNLLFVIIGEGPLMDGFKHRVKAENISNVRMLGKQLDVPKWLCAADAFMFPSIYEGLGIAAIEAQANGLPVLSTDSIPSEVDMHMGLFYPVSLKNPETWRRLLCNVYIDDEERLQVSSQAYNSHYNIKNVVREVEDIYLR